MKNKLQDAMTNETEKTELRKKHTIYYHLYYPGETQTFWQNRKQTQRESYQLKQIVNK